MIYENKEKNIYIRANNIEIGNKVSFGDNIRITTKGDFKLGDFSRLGDNCNFEGNNIIIGKHFYNSGAMIVGAGGQTYPNANLIIGDRCVVHNNIINICEPVEIGDDVGFSGRVEVITHGFWQSVLEGYPVSFNGVKIENGVILGFGSTLLMGASIAENIVLGSNSLVTKRLDLKKSVYAGSPAKFIRKIKEVKHEDKIKLLESIIDEYQKIAKYQNISPKINLKFPHITINKFNFNVITFEYSGIEDKETDNFRDYIRKWGIRIYTERPFDTHFKF